MFVCVCVNGYMCKCVCVYLRFNLCGALCLAQVLVLYSENNLSQIICNFQAYEEWSLILTGCKVLNITSKCFISCSHVWMCTVWKAESLFLVLNCTFPLLGAKRGTFL